MLRGLWPPSGTARGTRGLWALLLLVLGGCAANPRAGSRAGPQFAEFEGRRVRRVEFQGPVQLPRDSLQAAVATRASRCRLFGFLPFCVAGRGRQVFRFDPREFARDVVRLRLFYRDRGFYGTEVTPSVQVEGNGVAVRFQIAAGDRVVLDALSLQGVEGILPEAELRSALPQRIGEPFRRANFLASADTIRARLLERGYAYAQVLRNYSLDPVSDAAEVEFIAVPGPLVRVDTILVVGGEQLGEHTVRRQLTFREGQLFRASQLGRSQRNLFNLGLVSFASVELAPDSLQISPDSARATVVVRVVEDAKYAAETSLGYGTVDCFRTEARVTDRNFLGGGRRLEVVASARKIGAGRPLQFGLEKSPLCRNLDPTRGRDGSDDEPGDRFGNELDYRLAASFEQPRLFGTQNRVAVSARLERLSEFDVFQREAIGSQLAVTRELAPNTLLTGTFDVERGQTEADTAVFCVGFNVCTPEDIRQLGLARWSNSVALTLTQDRSRYASQLVEPVGGYTLRAATAVASPLLGSQDRYLSVTAQGAAYRQVRPGWVLAGRLQVGQFFDGEIGDLEEYIPPERRFYAGGPNTVRGFAPNELGPRVYIARTREPRDSVRGYPRLSAPYYSLIGNRPSGVDDAATGGTSLVVASAELRTPMPYIGRFARFAAFVDAGVLRTGRVELGDSGSLVRRAVTLGGTLAVTPGVGVRIATPVGPIRVDVALNTAGLEPGPLYLVDRPAGTITLLDADYRPEGRRGRFQVQLAVGQAF